MEELTPNPESGEQQQSHYVPRPTWQVWMARIGLVIMILGVGRGGLHNAGTPWLWWGWR